MKMADVIDLAINEYLWDGESNIITKPLPEGFCCDINVPRTYSVSFALRKAVNRDVRAHRKIQRFLETMGQPWAGYSTNHYSGIAWGKKRQYARALWLTWAVMIAKEEEAL